MSTLEIWYIDCQATERSTNCGLFIYLPPSWEIVFRFLYGSASNYLCQCRWLNLAYNIGKCEIINISWCVFCDRLFDDIHKRYIIRGLECKHIWTSIEELSDDEDKITWIKVFTLFIFPPFFFHFLLWMNYLYIFFGLFTHLSCAREGIFVTMCII